MNIVQGMGVALPIAAATPTGDSMMGQSVNGLSDSHQEVFFGDRSTMVEQQVHEILSKLSQYSENPTIPGSGTPQRSQGSGTR